MTCLIKEKVSVICRVSCPFFLPFANKVLIDFPLFIRYVWFAKAPKQYQEEVNPMKNRIRNLPLVLAGILAGVTLTSGAQAAAVRLTATRSNCAVYIDGQRTELTAYMINDENYVRLRDIGAKVGFNVYWDGTVQIETDKPYTGVAPKESTPSGTVTLPNDGSQYVPKAGDVILCDDGTLYTITDVSRWDNNAFSSGPLPPLPTPTCDWSSFPAVDLPAPEARHFIKSNGDYLYVRNLYETRRMQYTLMNLAGTNPETSVNGKLRYGSKGTPYVRISLTIPDTAGAWSFWPWRDSELTKLFNSCPPGSYSVEAWDTYIDGVYTHTEYRVYVI